MRTLIAFLFAALAIATGIWFGFLRGEEEAQADSRRRASSTPVILAPVVEAPFSESLEALGTAIANESVQLTANRSDLVRAIHFEDGQEVEQGAVLLELEMGEEEARLRESKAMLKEAIAKHRRAVELAQQNISPGSEVDAASAELEAAQARVATLEVLLEDHFVRAPFAGRLGLRRVSVGSLLQSATVITTLDDLSRIKVDFTIPETWLAGIQNGMPVNARTDAWPDDEFPGAITAVGTRLDPVARAATVRAVVPNPDGRLRPGMLVKVRVDRGESPSLQVPEESLVQRGQQHFVFVVGEDGLAQQTEVRVGRRRIGRVEVLEGLAVDQRVVVQGLARVRDGSPVDVVDVRGSTTSGG